MLLSPLALQKNHSVGLFKEYTERSKRLFGSMVFKVIFVSNPTTVEVDVVLWVSCDNIFLDETSNYNTPVSFANKSVFSRASIPDSGILANITRPTG